MDHGSWKLAGLETVAFATGLPDLLAGRILEVARGVWCHEAILGFLGLGMLQFLWDWIGVE